MASEKDSIIPLHDAMRDLGRWLEATNTLGMIIGGVAVAFLGRGRITRDVDALIWLEDEKLESFILAGQQFGFYSRFSGPAAFARKSHILAMRHHGTKVAVDVALGGLAFEKEALKHRRRVKVTDFNVAIPRAEDLILMKAVAHRDNDIVDIRGIIARQKKLDTRYLRKHAKEFAAMLDQPDIIDLIEQQLKSRRR